jgi:hypothetical protein
MQASVSPSIFVGTVRGNGGGFWNTPDGLPPASARAFDNAQIYTPIVVSVDTVIRGQPTAAALAAVLGGSVGCSRWTFIPAPVELTPDVRYLFFAQPGYDSIRRPNAFVLVWQAWPVSGNDLVETPEEGTLPLAAVTAEVEAHPVLGPGEPPPWPTNAPDASPTSDTYP